MALTSYSYHQMRAPNVCDVFVVTCSLSGGDIDWDRDGRLL